MPIRLNDGNLYVAKLEEVNRGLILSFFLNGHRDEILPLYGAGECYRGYISYTSLLESSDLEGALIKDRLCINDKLWENAQKMFTTQKNRSIPVLDSDMKIVYFATYEHKLEKAWKKLKELEEHINPQSWKRFVNSERHFHIVGVNDVLYFFRKWLIKMGAEVSVEGEQWKSFGINETGLKEKDAIIIDEECVQVHSLHQEYRSWMKKEISELSDLTSGFYVDVHSDDQILFYLPSYAYFVDGIITLIHKYLRLGKKCIISFPYLDDIISVGHENLKRMIVIIKQIIKWGGKVCNIKNDTGEFIGKYYICFLCSEYSGKLPKELRIRSKYIVGLQTTAIYTHMYRIQGRFEEVFCIDKEEQNDFLVSSNYMAEWIINQNNGCKKNFLKFGYPKLDALFDSLKNRNNIPSEWEKKINGRKVFLFTQLEEGWMNAIKEDKWAVIWRPHPLTIENNEDKINRICNKYKNVILDDKLSYYASFVLADALVAGPSISSIIINFLYTGKPVCFFDNKSEENIMDFRQEAWYKSMYIATTISDISEFIRSVVNDKINYKEIIERRKFIMEEFDGKVCDRIYEYFEKLW